MNIPEEAIEAAAIVLGTTKNGDPIVTVRLDDLGDLVGTTPEYWLSQARAALKAAAPLLMAQAWDEGLDAGSPYYAEKQDYENMLWDTEPEPPANPYRP